MDDKAGPLRRATAAQEEGTLADNPGDPATAYAGPARLVVCFDGTWNTVQSRTNVSRLFEAIADRDDAGRQQLKYYDEGVGRAPEAKNHLAAFWDGLVGGVYGRGLEVNVRQAYAWLCENWSRWEPRPDIFVFGFSRGAYTARVLNGMVGAAGLLRPREDGVPITAADKAVDEAWNFYRASGGRTLAEGPLAGRADPAVIRCLGVWDTVGRYGYPRWNGYAFQFKAVKFGNNKLGRHVADAFHAVAIDEHRAAYNAVLWDGWSDSRSGARAVERRIQQHWFPGAHAQVGGGYDNDLLCQITLDWMMRRAHDCGLVFQHEGAAGGLCARFTLVGNEHLAPLIDSHADFVGGLYALLYQRNYRRILVEDVMAEGPDGAPERRVQGVHPSAFAKMAADPDYRPFNLMHAGRLDLAAATDDDAVASAPGDSA